MRRCLALAMLAVAIGPQALAQSSSSEQDAQAVLASAASSQKYTFLLFYKDSGPSTQAMARTLKQSLATRRDEAAIAFVPATQRAQQELVQKFKVSRAPMPLVIAVAPNGAITGMYPLRITEQKIADAFVTPKMAECMKSMQAGRLVFVCVSDGVAAGVPQGVQDFQADPEFAGRAAVVSFAVHDPAEADFLKQLKIDPAALRGQTTAFLAPPAVLVGKFGVGASKEEMAAALHAAGKCCDDPNCKHNHGKKQARQNTRATR